MTVDAIRVSRCSGCKGEDMQPLLDVPGVPALCNVLWPSEDEARRAARGDLELAFCRSCGLISNLAFDPELVAYSPAYENSLHFSPAFQRYAHDLADRLIADHGLRGKRILEIGPGDGQFLSLLCERGDNEGIGVDPSHRGAEAPSERISIRRELYGQGQGADADFICCRHVLEHVADPLGLVTAIRDSIGGRRGVGVYFEVPDATYMLAQTAVWDLIYEHCSYFSAPALHRLFERGNFAVTATGTSFGGQYLWIEAAPRNGGGPAPRGPADLAELAMLAAGFRKAFIVETARWAQRLASLRAAGRVAVWGAGSKGVTFLNVVDGAGDIDLVVDVNPRKHGMHVPGTGHRVTRPQTLVAEPPRHVIVMNPLYEGEVRSMLAGLGVDAAVSVV